MSIDKSLVTKGKLTRHRNVHTRSERVKYLTKEDLWNEGMSVYGLPKVKITKARKKTKAVKEEKAEETTTEAASTTEEKKEKVSK